MIPLLPITNVQLLAGSAMVAVSGAAIGWVKGIPSQALGWLRRRISTEVYVGNESPTYDSICKFVTTDVSLRWIRKYTPIWKDNNSHLAPGLGLQYFFYKDVLVQMNRSVEKSTSTDSLWNELVQRSLLAKPESINFVFFSRNKDIPHQFIKEATLGLKRNEYTGVYLYTPSCDDWIQRKRLTLRAPTTVILPNHQMQDLIDDINTFHSRQKWYHDIGIPYRRGYLFHGIPGSGKTSVIAALCSEHKLDVYILSLTAMTEERLQKLVNGIPPRCALVLEDLDSLYNQAEAKNLTMSGLLNALDGLVYADGALIFATTNHFNKLDPALTRKGRFDMQVEFKHATAEQICHFTGKFYGHAIPEIEGAKVAERNVSMAELQAACLAQSSYELAFKELGI